jgi:hypothetical protein
VKVDRSFWKSREGLIAIGLIIAGIWIIWEVAMRIRDVVEIGTATDQ